MHQGRRHQESRRHRPVIARRQFKSISQHGKEIRGGVQLIGVERQPQIAARELRSVFPEEAVHQIRLADPRHTRDDHRTARSGCREERGGKLLAFRSPADKQILDPRMRQ